MKKSIRNALKLTLKSWRVLFLFEIFYKGLGSLILIPLLHGWLNIGLSLTKINYISSTNIYRIFTSPGMMFFIITAIIVVAVVMIFEFNCLAICFNQARENKELGIIQLFKQGFSRSKRLLSPRNWILIPFTVVIIPFTQLILTSSFVSNLELPRFKINDCKLETKRQASYPNDLGLHFIDSACFLYHDINLCGNFSVGFSGSESLLSAGG